MNINFKLKILNLKLFEKGQALVTLLVFMAVAIIIISAAVAVTVINTQSGTTFSIGQEALYIAETGAEEAILRLLRDPNYGQSVQTIPVGTGNALVIVDSSIPNRKIITSEGVLGEFRRKILVDTSYIDTISINSWREIP